MSENNDAATKAADDKKKTDAEAKKKADAEAKKKADAEAKKKTDADAKARAEADKKAQEEAAVKKPKRVRVICEGTLGPQLFKKGDVTDDPEYVGLLETQGNRKLVEEVK